MPRGPPRRSIALMHRRLLTTTAAAALALGAAASLPATGTADPIPDPPKRVAYDIEIAGLGSYERYDRFGAENDPSSTTEALRFDFSYTSTYQDVVFVDGRLQSVRIAPEQDGAIAVREGKIEHRDSQGRITDTITCKADPRLDTAGDGSLEPDLVAGIGSERLLFRPADVVAATLDCDDADPARDHEEATWAPTSRSGWSATGPAEVGKGPLDMNFDLPFGALGMGFIEHPVDPAPEQLEGPHCPGWTMAVTQTCKLEWTGTVRMTKVDDGAGGTPGKGGPATPGTPITPADIPLPPKPAPAPAPAPKPAPRPAPATGQAPTVTGAA